MLLTLLVAAQVSAAPAVAPAPILDRRAAELIADQFIVDGSGMSDWDTPDRLQIWEVAVEHLRRYGLTVAAFPIIRAAYAADRKRLTDLYLRESARRVDLYGYLAAKDMKAAAAAQLDIDKLVAQEKAVERHILLDTYLREVASQTRARH